VVAVAAARRDSTFMIESFVGIDFVNATVRGPV
jgi:hypothetical protein